jgi:peptide/nickel transport system substrate-binding protein
MKLRVLKAGTALMLGLFLTATFARDTDVGTPREETLIVDMLNARVSNPMQMNPFVEGVTISQGLHQLAYSQLWDIDTVTGKQFPALAASMPEPLNKDFTKFRIKLRQGLSWDDGKPFSADDVIFTAEMLMGSEKLPGGAYIKGVIKSIRKIDNYTIELDTVKPYPRLSVALGSVIYGNLFRPVPKHIWKDVDPATFANYPPVGIGPYKFKQADPNGFWFLWEKRTDWKASDAGQIKGEPKPKFVLFRSYGTEEKRVLAMAQNDYDVLTDITPEGLDILRKRNKNVLAWYDKFPWANMDDPCERGIHFNLQTPPYDKWQVRWALALATNIENVSMGTMSGMLRVSPLAVPPVSIVSKTYHEPMANWLAAMTLPDGYKPFDDKFAIRMAARLRSEGVDSIPTDAAGVRALFGIGWWKHDPAKAAQLLESVGFKKAGGQWLKPDGTPWKMVMVAPADFEIQSQRLAFAVANEWRSFGVDVPVQQMQGGPFNTAYATGNFDAGSYWGSSCAIGPDLFVRMEGWHSRYVRPTGTPASFNKERFSNAVVDAQIDKLSAMSSTDPGVVVAGTAILQEMARQLPVIEMFGTSKFVPVNTYYWDNFPTAKNYYEGPWWWWSSFKYTVSQLKSTGRK